MTMLTERENAICKLRDQGMSWSEIARELGIKKGSASASFKNAMKKLEGGAETHISNTEDILDRYLDPNVVASSSAADLALVIETSIMRSRLLTQNRDKLAAAHQELETELGRRGLTIINDPTSGEIRVIDDGGQDAVSRS